jgi:hypothetical protein
MIGRGPALDEAREEPSAMEAVAPVVLSRTIRDGDLKITLCQVAGDTRILSWQKPLTGVGA